MYPCSFLAIIEVLRDQALPIPVCEKVDCPSWNDAYQIRSQTFEQGAPSLDFWNRKEYLEAIFGLGLQVMLDSLYLLCSASSWIQALEEGFISTHTQIRRNALFLRDFYYPVASLDRSCMAS